MCVICMNPLTSLFLTQTVSVGRRKFSANFQLAFRLIKGMIFLTFISILVTLIALPHMTVQDIFVCILAFMPTGWGMLVVSEFLSCSFYIFCQCSWHLAHLSLKCGVDELSTLFGLFRFGYLNYAWQIQYLAEFRLINFKFASP
jgi:hypothetical protein